MSPNYMANAADLPDDEGTVMDEPVTPPDPGALLPARVRAIVYVVAVMVSAAYAVAAANSVLHWGWAAAYAAFNAGVGALAVSNTPRSR